MYKLHSELSKLTECILAQRISSVNSVSAICEATGANIQEVATGIRSVIVKLLNAGLALRSCFKRIFNLVYLCRYFDLDEVADYWEQTVHIINWQQNRIYRKRVDSFLKFIWQENSYFGFRIQSKYQR